MGSPSVGWPLERCEPQAVGMCPRRLGRVGELIGRYIEEGRIAGAVTLAARRGRIAHLQCHGLMDLEKRIPMRDDAIFRIYSMTKIVTSAAVLMLVEEGRFLLAQPVSQFLPEFKQLRVAVKGADGQEELVRPRRELTVHDLLTHTGGLSYDLIHEARDQGWTLKRFVEEFCRRPLRRHPGELWDYSAATDCLGRLVEVVGGKPFEDFLQERIFGPLGMADTAFWVPPDKADRLAAWYKPDEAGKLVPVMQLGDNSPAVGRPFLEKPALPSGGGGLVSTTSDYLRFALMLLWKGALGEVRLLGKKTVELMTSDHLPPGHAALDNHRGFGLGVSVARHLGELRQIGSVGEFGWGGAACTQAWIDPAEDMVTIIMTQLLPKEKAWFLDQFKQAVYQAVVD